MSLNNSVILPITKEQVLNNIEKQFPSFVIQAFNECIQESKSKGSDKVLQKDVINKIINLTEGKYTASELYSNNWLDIETLYTQYGWSVSYHKPAYNETDDRYFIFK